MLAATIAIAVADEVAPAYTPALVPVHFDRPGAVEVSPVRYCRAQAEADIRAAAAPKMRPMFAGSKNSTGETVPATTLDEVVHRLLVAVDRAEQLLHLRRGGSMVASWVVNS